MGYAIMTVSIMKKLRTIIKKYDYAIVIAILAIMFLLGLGSMRGDSAIVDEVAHIPAGYSYVTKGDYRLNPEHPPLMKDLAGLAIIPLHPRFPDDTQAWQTDVNGQWEAGWHFLYHDGNNADAILFWSRLPILLCAIAFGAVLYIISKRLLGVAGGFVVVTLYAFEPNIIAHARFVTTDLGAAATAFVAIVSFYYWLRRPSWRRLLLATTAFFVAQVTKFSAIMLAPFFIILIVWALATRQSGKPWRDVWKTYLVGYVLLGLGALAMIWLFYIPHVWNMTKATQDALIRGSLRDSKQQFIVTFLTAINGTLVTRAIAQYLLGVVMVFSRVSGGNTTYFLGEVTNQSFKWYFPVTYAIKTPLSLLIVSFVGIVTGLVSVLKHSLGKWPSRFKRYSQQHPVEVVALMYIAFYSGISISGNLNLGIRHLMPIIPFVCFVVGSFSVRFARRMQNHAITAAGLILLAAYVAAAVFSYPHYLSYFNQLIGGGRNANKYVSDSSVDWGQDLKRLKAYVQQHPDISTLHLDYFGGGEPKYYFCDRVYKNHMLVRNSKGYDCTKSVYVEWHANYGLPHGYLAVSETYLENDRWASKLRGDVGYTGLYDVKPYAIIGNSIYIYKLP